MSESVAIHDDGTESVPIRVVTRPDGTRTVEVQGPDGLDWASIEQYLAKRLNKTRLVTAGEVVLESTPRGYRIEDVEIVEAFLRSGRSVDVEEIAGLAEGSG